MSENLYAPPSAVVAELAPVERRTEFYVVSGVKMALLTIATMGLYQTYWSYMHWARYRTWHKIKDQPAARAIFFVLYTHSLAIKIDRRLREKAIALDWWPLTTATGFVLLVLVGYVYDLLPGETPAWMYFASLLLLAPQTWLMWRMQRAANLACGQPAAESNQTVTWANWVWIALGAMLWLSVLLSLWTWAVPVDVDLPSR